MKKPLFFIPSKNLKRGERKRVMKTEDMSKDIEQEFKNHHDRLQNNWFNQFMSLCQAIEIHNIDPMIWMKNACEHYKENYGNKKENGKNMQ